MLVNCNSLVRTYLFLSSLFVVSIECLDGESFWPLTVSLLEDGSKPLGELVLESIQKDEVPDSFNRKAVFKVNPDFECNGGSESQSALTTLSFQSKTGIELGFYSLKCSNSCRMDLEIWLNKHGVPNSFIFRNVEQENSENKLLIKDVQLLNPGPGASPRLFLEYKDEHAKTKDSDENKSFLSRYWYIIVPGVVLLLLSTSPPEEEGQGAPSRAIPV